MTSLLDYSVFNTTLLDELFRHISETSHLLYGFIASSAASTATEDLSLVPAVTLLQQLAPVFYFDDFQLTLLKTFVFMQFFTLLLIFLSWKVYGKRISERFMTPATSKAIQELKDSVSRLKLPKEHTPRI